MTALTLREQNKLTQEIAAGAAPMLAEAYFAAAMESSDTETMGKALDRAAKITGLTEDRGASSLPTINITFSGTAFQIGSVAPPTLELLKDTTPLRTGPGRDDMGAALRAPHHQPGDAVGFMLDADPEPAWATAFGGVDD